MQKEKQQSSMQEKLAGNEKLRAVPKQFYKGRPLPEKDEDVEPFVDEVVTDYTAFTQEQGYENNNFHKPPQGDKPPAGGKGKIDQDLVNHAKKQNEKALAAKEQK